MDMHEGDPEALRFATQPQPPHPPSHTSLPALPRIANRLDRDMGDPGCV
jgi:hypothetical protein